jgi:hypothetical protein
MAAHVEMSEVKIARLDDKDKEKKEDEEKEDINNIEIYGLEEEPEPEENNEISMIKRTNMRYPRTPMTRSYTGINPVSPEPTRYKNQPEVATFEKLSYKTVDEMIKTVYNYKENYGSTALDILAIYIKGQKILYTEAKTFCEQRLNLLMLPAIFISALCTVLSLVLKDYAWGTIIISSISAFNSFILSLISFLKLDAKSEAHKMSAYKFDKLQSQCEFSSGKVLFSDNINNDKYGENITKIIEDIEIQVKEIKETNHFILPETIRFTYPKLYSANIFAVVKKIQNKEITLINNLKNIINKTIDYVNMEPSPEIRQRIRGLEQEQNNIIDDIIKFRNNYLNIDQDFEDEINKNIKEQMGCCNCNFCALLKS